jgi:RNAse (barnase) inhibitor barstar
MIPTASVDVSTNATGPTVSALERSWRVLSLRSLAAAWHACGSRRGGRSLLGIPVAAFSPDGSDFQRLDWQLLQNGAVSLYFRHELLDQDVRWLEEHAYRVTEVDCRGWADASAMHRDIAARLAFPPHFGMNLDAMNDCLADVDVPADGGLVLVFRHFDGFAARHRDVAQGLLDVLADNARRFLLFGRRLMALVQSEDPRIAFAPVGATAVGWNPKEWLQEKRGL